MSSQVIDGWKPIRGTPGKTIVTQNSDGSYTVTIDPSAIGDGGGDMLKAVYDIDGNGIVDSAESVPWAGVTDKPLVFPPDAHTHSGSDVTSQVSSAASADSVPWAGVTDKPLVFPPDAHTHDDRYYTESEIGTLLGGYVLKSTFDANSLLIANTDDTPTALTVGASTIVGRGASGGIAALSASDARTILGLGTAALRDVAQTFTAAQTFSSVLTAPGIKPASDSVDAIKITDAGGANALMSFDTTNQRVSLNAENVELDNSGNLTIGGILAMQPRQIAAVLTASDAAVNDYFGTSVALSADGSILAVGALFWEGAAANQGGVYIYDWSGGAWVQRGSVLTASDAAASDNFGISVALSADASVLAVGAYGWEGAATNQGGVYIYNWSGGAWVQRGSVLTASDAAASDFFGRSVALSSDGSILAVGAFFWEGAAANQGGVYIYDWSGGAWVQRGSVLTASDAAASDNFGRSVALSSDGSILAVGAFFWEGAAANQGGVYIYDWSGGAWVQRGSVLTASDAAAGDNFGTSVALSADGSILAVGAYLWEGAAADQGGVYIYDWSGDAWVQRGSVLTASDAAAGDNFGTSVALSADGSILAVGAYLWEGAVADQGGVYTFAAVASGWPHHSALLRWQATVAGTTKSTPGTVNKWLQLLVDGTMHYIPCYTSTTS